MRVEFNAEASGKEPAYSGRVIKILDKFKARVYAVFRKAADGSGRALPVEKRSAGRDFFVPEALAGDAEDGDLVAIEPVRAGRLGLPTARVVETLGSVKSERAVSLIALATHHIPHVFSPAALNEAETARPVRLQPPREDWRALPLVTIDPPDAKDHDDAVHAAPDPDPANPGGFIVTVAIADVAAYVRPGSALDRDALERGNSVYFPDRVVPMLPERISNDLCSLARRGPARARGAHGPERGRTQALARLPPRHDALGGEAHLRAGAGGDRRAAGRDDRPAARDRAQAALRGARGHQTRTRATRSARSRPARAQAHPRQGGPPRRRALARTARRPSADRGVHDPRQCRGGRDARGAALAADLSRPRRAERREARTTSSSFWARSASSSPRATGCGRRTSTAC